MSFPVFTPELRDTALVLQSAVSERLLSRGIVSQSAADLRDAITSDLLPHRSRALAAEVELVFSGAGLLPDADLSALRYLLVEGRLP